MRTEVLTTISLLFLMFFSTINPSAQPSWISLISLSLAMVVITLPLAMNRHARRNGYLTTTIPGPRGWPLLGSLPAVSGPLMHRRLAALADAHGASRLMSFSLGSMPVVISSHPETAREILSGPAFVDRPIKAAARELMFCRSIGFAPAGDYWRRLRRIAGDGMLSPRRIAALGGLRQRVADGMAKNISNEMESAGKVAMRAMLQRASLDNMVGSVLGLEGASEDMNAMVKEGYELVGMFNLGDYYTSASGAGIPLIDLKQLDGPERPKVIEAIVSACETGGSFMVKNHGIPEAVVEGILHVAREFFHLPESERLKCYSDDHKKAIRPSTSFNVRTEEVSNWRNFLRLHCYPLESFIDQWPSNPPAFSFYVPFDFKDFGLTDKEEYSYAMHSIVETSSITVPEIIRIRPSGNEHWRESMLALGILFEGPSTPTAESSSVDTVVNRVLFLDSAAGRHMVSHAALLSNPRDPPAGMDRVRTADGTLLPVVGYGDIQMEGFDIPDVCLVRGLEFNVISVGQLARSHNICSCFFRDQCNLMLSDGRLIGGAFRRNDNQYILRFLEIP